MLPILWILSLSCLCLANTETILIKIPHFYNVPSSPGSYSRREIDRVNATHSTLLDYPINSIDLLHSENTIATTYNTINPTKQVLLVKVNNYNGTTYSPDDLITVKLCWPATEPYSFDLSYKFLRPSEVTDDNDTQLELFVQIEYEFFGKSLDPSIFSAEDELKFQLFITKLPSKWLPIPAELYQFIIVFVDILILTITTVPYAYEYLFGTCS